jgi:hypothetical protein
VVKREGLCSVELAGQLTFSAQITEFYSDRVAGALEINCQYRGTFLMLVFGHAYVIKPLEFRFNTYKAT